MANSADLLVDNVKIINQPFRSRADEFAPSQILAKALVSSRNLPPIALKRGAQGVSTRGPHSSGAMLGSQCTGMIIEQRGTQQVSA